MVVLLFVIVLASVHPPSQDRQEIYPERRDERWQGPDKIQWLYLTVIGGRVGHRSDYSIIDFAVKLLLSGFLAPFQTSYVAFR